MTKIFFPEQGYLYTIIFVFKTLDKVRPGGVVAFVTSKGTSMR